MSREVLEMAQLVVICKQPPSAVVDNRNEQKNVLQDWDSFLHLQWLDMIKTNPGLYNDTKINHATGHCPCRCTANEYLIEVHRRI